MRGSIWLALSVAACRPQTIDVTPTPVYADHGDTGDGDGHAGDGDGHAGDGDGGVGDGDGSASELASGQVGFRIAYLAPGEHWWIDDVVVRLYADPPSVVVGVSSDASACH